MNRENMASKSMERAVRGHVLRMSANLICIVEVYLLGGPRCPENQIAVACWMSAISVAAA
jgi:hypothetical protein